MLTSRLLGFCLSLFILASALLPVGASAHSLVATYVTWGVDEYELFGLTKVEIAKQFKDILGFDEQDSRIFFVGYNRAGFGRPGFLVTFASGKVAAIRRLFIDGGGCHILGPTFTTKKEALNFMIQGLSAQPNRSAKDQARLVEARKKLAALTG
ncbi:MAG: hypothetical protein KGS72_22570 [Cyanobacteria bacterium REEB67]|nr:hypothetical protein [Cyanobacteria bacterium REEB67]